jgi:DNA-directed RNA polymerase subunit omega
MPIARVTVEDCVTRIPNRFELVMMAGRRARDLAAGAEPSLDRDNDKSTVIALREIAERTLSLENLREALVKGHQRQVEVDEPDEDIAELMASEQAWADLSSPSDGAEPGASDGDETEVPLSDLDPEADDIGGDEGTGQDDDVLTRMDREPGASFVGDEGNLVDRDVNDLGKAYGDDAEGISDAMDDPNNRFYD